MRLRAHINKVVFGAVAAALQLLPGQGKAGDEDAGRCEQEEQTVDTLFTDCMGTSFAEACLECIQGSSFQEANQQLTDCLGSESLKSWTDYYPVLCNLLSGGTHNPGSSGATN